MPIPYLSIGAALASSVFSYIGAQQQRKQAMKDQDNQFVRMRNAAQRAGFNPLTVLRLTGGQGFSGLPTISKAAAFGNAALGVFDAFKNAPIEKYQEKVRDLTLKDIRARIDNTLVNTAYTGILSKQAARVMGSGLTQLPGEYITSEKIPMSVPQLSSMVNDALAVADGKIVASEPVPYAQQTVNLDGTTQIEPRGDDFDEQMWWALKQGLRQSVIGFGELSTNIFGGTPYEGLQKVGSLPIWSKIGKKME